jgi:hypothetical protein
MTRVNLEREFGVAVEGLHLPVERPAICDSRMMPYEWLLTEEGRWSKLNAAMHGDDHFFPGPCDIAWDLAGIVVEWDLSTPARQMLLEKYRQVSGDDVAQRIGNYEVAYAIFRTGWSKIAAHSVAAGEGAERLLRHYERYRGWLEQHDAPKYRSVSVDRCPENHDVHTVIKG